MTDPILVLCMKWGTLYGAADVNRLAAQVRRNLARPHRFICFTDDAAGLDAGVEPLPLPELGLPPEPSQTFSRAQVVSDARSVVPLTATTHGELAGKLAELGWSSPHSSAPESPVDTLKVWPCDAAIWNIALLACMEPSPPWLAS